MAERALAAITSPTGQRILIGLTVLLIAFLWANMVRRALKGGGSQYDDFLGFSRDLVWERIDVYQAYAFEETSITKYPPFFGLLFAPLVPLPVWLGASIWFLLSLGLATAATWLGVRTVEERPGVTEGRPALFYVLPFVLASGIIGSNLETAQVNIFMLFFICLALYAFKRGADLSAGLSLGLVTALKLTPGLFIVYFLYKRAWRVVAGGVLGLAACWIGLSLPVLGPDHWAATMTGWWGDLIPYLRKGLLAEGIPGFRHTNQSFSAVFHRLFTETPAGAGRSDFYLNVASLSYAAAGVVVRVVSAAILIGLVWLCRTPTGDRGRLGLSLEYSLVFIATLIISPVSWINHYVALLFPFAAGVYYVATRPADRPGRRVMFWALALAFVLVSSSASRLMQAFSLPFLGAAILFVAMAYALIGERSAVAGPAPAGGGAPRAASQP
jgi:hypothetical protein